MKKDIDCLLIGHNQTDFNDYVSLIEKMGQKSSVLRDFNRNYILYDNKPYNPIDIFNSFCVNANTENNLIKVKPIEIFSPAIAYLGTFLNKRGNTFEFINSFQEEKIKLKNMLLNDNVLLIAITSTLYVYPLPLIEIVRFIREYSKDVKIVIGGPFISNQVRVLNASELDFLFNTLDADYYINSCQGESALAGLIETIKTGSSLNQVSNVFYRVNDSFKETGVEQEKNQLAENMIEWDFFSEDVGDFANLRTSISCPFSCSFCAFPEHAGEYQVVNVDLIEKELNKLNSYKKIKSITFIDDTFNIPQKRFVDILKMMIKNNYSFSWNSYFRCQYADEDMVKLMKESGCESVFLGLESGSDVILTNMNKKTSVEKYLRGIELLKKYEITTFGNFIVGFPGETDKTVNETINFIQQSGLDFYRAQLWYCDPITPIWKEKDKFKLEGENFEWKHSTMNSLEANSYIDNMISVIDYPVRVPQYYFDFDSLNHLKHKGLSILQIKNFLLYFNNGIREKLTQPNREIDYEIFQKMINSCTHNQSILNGEIKFEYEADFDF